MVDKKPNVSVYLLDAQDSLAIPFVHALSKNNTYEMYAFTFGSRSALMHSTLCTTFNFDDAMATLKPHMLKERKVSKNKELLIPLTTNAIEWVLRNKQQLLPDWLLPDLPSPERIQIAKHKNLFHDLLSFLGVPSPRTWKSSQFSSKEIQDFPYPVLLKPTVGQGGAGIKIVKGPAEFADLIGTRDNHDDFIAQEFVTGVGRGCGIFCQNGRIILYVLFEKLTTKGPFGPTQSYRFIRDDKVLASIAKIAVHMNLNGLANFDLLYVPQQDTTLVLELNLRAWASLRGSANYGINFPEAVCRAVTGQVVIPRQVHDGYVIQNWDLVSLAPKIFLKGEKISNVLPGLSVNFIVRDLRASVLHAMQSVWRTT